MMLVDTSVWVDHLRRTDPSLSSALERSEVWCHPFVIGELACGDLANRQEILSLLAALPQAELAAHHEVLALVERFRHTGHTVRIIEFMDVGTSNRWSRDEVVPSAELVESIHAQ